MADEPTTTTGAETDATATPTVPEVVEAAAPDPQAQKIQELTEKVTRYEQLVVTPEYQAFLAQRGQQPAPQKREYSDEEKTKFQEKLNSMSRAEFAAFVRDLTVETVKEQMFLPIQSAMVTEKVKDQIVDVSTKFPDFWDYRAEMIGISNSNPTLNAEQVYHLAKAGRASAPTNTQAKPPARKPGGETPAGVPTTRTEKTSPDFNAAFETAFKKVGL